MIDIALGQASVAPRAEWQNLARQSFAGQPSQVGQARRWLSNLLDGFPATDDALLALSEFAANAVRHSDSRLLGGTFTVRVAIDPALVRIEVIDQGGEWSNLSGPNGQYGRGLAIVAAIASAWGVTGDHAGRIAWCEVRPD